MPASTAKALRGSPAGVASRRFLRFKGVWKHVWYARIVWFDGIQRRGDEKAPAARHLQAFQENHRRGARPRPRDGRRGGQRHEGLGAGKRRYPLYPLVPAHDRGHRRKARGLHLAQGRRGHHGVLRQGINQGRTGRLLLPLGRTARHLRGPRLYGLGPHQLRLYQGRHAVHPHGLLLLHRRRAGQKDAASALHGGAQRAGPAHPQAVWQHAGQEGDDHRRPGAGVFPD